jgi:hypothetical protein
LENNRTLPNRRLQHQIYPYRPPQIFVRDGTHRKNSYSRHRARA